MGGKGSGRFKPGDPAIAKTSPMVQSASYNADPVINTRVINFTIELMDLPDIDLGDAEAVAERAREYMVVCARHEMRPTVSSMAMAFNAMNRATLQDIYTDRNTTYGGITPASILEIKKAYKMLEVLFESNLSEEKGSPVKWFFLGKNNYGYVDQKQQVTIAVDATKQLGSSEEVLAKYRQIASADGEYELPPHDVE